MSVSIILLIVAAVIALMLIGIYNRLVSLRASTNQAFADIDVQLKQRHDLIPNLVETVKGYATHEKSTLDAVITARNAAVQARGPSGQAQAEQQLTSALGGIFALAEAYPQLKANENFLRLQADLSDIENKLAAARRFFNSAVQEYNAAIQQFPAVLFASMFGFNDRGSFDVGDIERKTLDKPVEVKF